jgi:hypothetical protein
MQPRGPLLLFSGAVALVACFWLAPRFPKDQSVNVVLGDSSPAVTELALQYRSVATTSDEVAREAVFAFAEGAAPRVVHHAPRLPDGEYVVDVRVRSRKGAADKKRRVTLNGGGSTSIDLGGLE